MDTTAIILGIISFLGTVIGTFAGIITSAKLTNYRLYVEKSGIGNLGIN